MERLNGYRMKLVVVGCVASVVIGNKFAKADFTFGEPTNLGPSINSSAREQGPSISSDSLELYFMSQRSGGYGDWDIYVAERETVADDWGTAVNLGSTINSTFRDGQPEISADGLSLFFDSDRPGGQGSSDLWMTTQRDMFKGSVTLSDHYRYWWSYIPHFLHTPGYVYAYAFGELLVLALFGEYQKQGKNFPDRYMDLLRAGGSDWPHVLVGRLGVDLTDLGFWKQGLESIEAMIAGAERLASDAA